MRLVRAGGSVAPRVVEVPAPAAPEGTQVLVRVAASSVNGTDLGLLRGGRLFRALSGGRVAPGFDVAGEVVACGPTVTGFDVGDRVMALIGHAGGGMAELVLLPQHRVARGPRALDLEQAAGGGMAELVLLPQHRVARAPRTIDLEQAAGIPLAGLTALQALHGRAGLHARAAPRVLVVGAAGGIGGYAVQLARLAGASVTAVADPARADFLRDLGADVVVDRHGDDVLAGDRQWDVVLDAPGALRFAAVRPSLTRDGVLVSTRPLSPDTVRGLRLRHGPRVTAVATRRSPVDLAHLAHLVDTARLRVPLDRVVALEDVASAFEHAGSGQLRGKVVVSLAERP
ncbi:NAD(P)-dependent alcohol dehydrogenase [Geodermatophilus siccatus]|uniref:NAD(P)-dependent alcohol dehydrogenase n=1 Tax=Geodermatophilus siccatus TaxID=1137991 RepID=UPI00158751F9|nr:NAD(P)-dependent alcohol dehydrogenase [Geodermatophilus siccatus]